MTVNNETGVIQPISDISSISKSRGILFHTDATQALGKVPTKVISLADMISFSGHKINGPKGIGALWIRPDIVMSPLLVGGGQEAGLRAGTVPVPLVVAFATAVDIAINDTGWIENIRDPMRDLEKILAIPGSIINGSGAPRVPSIVNICYPYNKKVIDAVSGVAVSAGSACGCTKAKPSKVLTAMGLPSNYANNSLRVSAGRTTTPDEIRKASQLLLRYIRLINDQPQD